MSQPAESALRRWPAFRNAFFAAPNALRPDNGIEQLDHLVGTARELLANDPPGPIVLPAVVRGTTHYFGLAFTPEQTRVLRELLQSHVGNTWTDFEGQAIHACRTDDPLERAAVAFAGDSRYVFRFRVAASARDIVRASVHALMRTVVSTPRRQARMSLPIGRLIADLADACAAGAENAAHRAYSALLADHRVSRANKLFLEVQVLAAFQRWDDLDQHADLDNILRLPRPALASDALARLALSKLPNPPDLENFEPVATRFGALIDSVSAVRSAPGAHYYTLWALRGGEQRVPLHQRLTAAGWSTDPTIAALLGPALAQFGTSAPASATALRQQAKKAIDEGRFDAAVDLLSELPPDVVDLPAVLEAVSRTFTAKAIALLEHHRAAHGEDAVSSAVRPGLRVDTSAHASSLPEKLAGLFSTATASAQVAKLREAIEQTGVADLRAPGTVNAVCQTIREVITNGGPGRLVPGLDLCIDLVRDLKTSGAVVDDIRDLALSVLELWAYHDNTGDRHRAARIAQLTGELVETGLGIQGFDDAVELIRAGWDPFLTDADLPTGLTLLEQLIAHRAGSAECLDKFAIPLLSRIGPHNAYRVPSAALAVAADLAPSFGLEIEVPPPAVMAAVPVTIGPPAKKIGLYSLQEQALDRAARLLQQRHPGVQVLASADHVSTDALRHAARSADLFVIADRAAAHAATDAIKAERRSAPIRYAAGKGSTSMIEAVEVWLQEQASGEAGADGS